jgi:hypothetical protein
MSGSTGSAPTDPEAVQILSELCDAEVPQDYLTLLQNFPELLKQVSRADDGSDSEGFVSDVELISDIREVVGINCEARTGCVLDPAGEEFCWPDQLLIIGESGDGDYFCIDTSHEHEGVLQFLHHPVEFEQIAESLAEYVDMLLETFGAED